MENYQKKQDSPGTFRSALVFVFEEQEDFEDIFVFEECTEDDVDSLIEEATDENDETENYELRANGIQYSE